MAHQPPCKKQKQGTISSFYLKITAIPIINVESGNDEISAVVADTVNAVSSTSLSSFKEGKRETLTITDTGQQPVQEKNSSSYESYPCIIHIDCGYLGRICYVYTRETQSGGGTWSLL